MADELDFRRVADKLADVSVWMWKLSGRDGFPNSLDESQNAIRNEYRSLQYDNNKLASRVAALEAALRYIRDYASLPLMADVRENALAAIAVTAEDALAATDADAKGAENGDDQ